MHEAEVMAQTFDEEKAGLSQKIADLEEELSTLRVSQGTPSQEQQLIQKLQFEIRKHKDELERHQRMALDKLLKAQDEAKQELELAEYNNK